MAKIVIGIHGLSRKPENKQLYQWWLQALNDGLKKTGDFTLDKKQFRLAYWADLMHELPDESPEPYTDPDTDEPDGSRSKIVAIGRQFFSDIIGNFGDLKVQMTDGKRIQGIKNAVIKKVVSDLAKYYDEKQTIEYGSFAGTQTKQALRSILKGIIERHQGDEIFLIGHSMGSIIAYDVLRDLRDSSIKISRFVTIGSPLGLPTVKNNTRKEWDDKDGPYVPEVLLHHWKNYADPKDLVCTDLTLNGEYKRFNGLDVEDVVVSNGYYYKKKHNHHKSYGYLRTEELAQDLNDFLG